MNAAELARELNVSRRTLFRDLNMLEAAGIPYLFSHDDGYKVAPSFFLPPMNLKVSEAMGLMMLAKTAAAQKPAPMTAPAIDAVRKLIALMPAPIRDVTSEMMSRVSVRPGSLSAADHEHDAYADLQSAIDQNRVVSMRYLSLFEGGEIDERIEPYHLHFAARAWYVIGRSRTHKDIRTYKLGRIRAMTLEHATFKPDTKFTIDGYLGKAWSLIPEGKVHRIELEFTPKVAANVSEVRWHPTQQHQMLDDGRCLMTFEVDGLGEISWWLLGYGDQVLVRKPAELRRRLVEVYQSALNRNRKAAAS